MNSVEYSGIYTAKRLEKENLIDSGLNFSGKITSDRSAPIFTAKPKGVYGKIAEFFVLSGNTEIYPVDSESRLFLPKILIGGEAAEIENIAKSKNPGALILNDGTVSVWSKKDSVDLSVIFTTVCYAIYIVFYTSMKIKKRNGVKFSTVESAIIHNTGERKKMIGEKIFDDVKFSNFSERGITGYMEEAGKVICSLGLVNSFFGNISLRTGERIYISESGSYLDHLEGKIIKCDLKRSRCSNSSSEYPSHRKIYLKTDYNIIIHGHPVFTVIESLDCDYKHQKKSICRLYACDHNRNIFQVPVISGKTGGGKYGLDKFLPAVINNYGMAVVCGHGVFIAGNDNYGDLIKRMINFENKCRRRLLEELL